MLMEIFMEIWNFGERHKCIENVKVGWLFKRQKAVERH